MSKILIDLEKIRYPFNGIGQYGMRYGEALAKLDKNKLNELNPYLLIPKNKQNIFGDNVNYYTEKKILRLLPLLQKKFDLWHSIHQSPRHMPFHSSTKFLYSILDLNFLDESTDKNWIKKELKRIQKCIDRSVGITVISNYVANHIQEHLDLKNKPIDVVYLSHSININLTGARPPFWKTNRPFLFTIGVVDPKKNFHVLLPLINKLKDRELVIAGPNNTEYAKEIRSLARKLNINSKIHLVGAINDDYKKWFYDNCEAFVFPSLLEGFGMPPLEAMYIGRPTFISNRCSLPEITGGEAFIWNNFDANEMVKMYESKINQYSKNESKKNKIIAHARKFSWSKTAEQYLNIYSRILNN